MYFMILNKDPIRRVVFVSEPSIHSLVCTSQMHTSNIHPAWPKFPTPKTDSTNNRLALKGGEESPKILHSMEKRWREVIITQKNVMTTSLSQPLLLKDTHSEITNSDLI